MTPEELARLCDDRLAELAAQGIGASPQPCIDDVRQAVAQATGSDERDVSVTLLADRVDVEIAGRIHHVRSTVRVGS